MLRKIGHTNWLNAFLADLHAGETLEEEFYHCQQIYIWCDLEDEGGGGGGGEEGGGGGGGGTNTICFFSIAAWIVPIFFFFLIF
jgi:hypothetical protein